MHKIVITIILAIAFSSACTFVDVTSTDKSEVYEIDGLWTGYTEQRQAIIFEILDRRFTQVQVGIQSDNPDCITQSFKFSVEKPKDIGENTFAMKVYGDNLRGSFESSTRATGNYSTDWFHEPSCLRGEVFRWHAVKRSLPDIQTCTIVTIDKEVEVPDITNFPEIKQAPDGACLKVNKVNFVKRAIGSIIAPYSSTMAAYYIWVPQRTFIMYDYSAWKTERWESFELKGDELFLPGTNIPVLEWDGSFYRALVDFYEPLVELQR